MSKNAADTDILLRRCIGRCPASREVYLNPIVRDKKGKFISVQETRLTALFMHIFMMISIFALSILKMIPMLVLYGVFLYMGLSSLGTNQFFGRMCMFFMQPSKYPKHPYTESMMAHRMHIFTAIQVFLFASMYVVKSIKTIAIAFPIVIALCIPIRLYLLPKIFTEEELILIDTDEETIRSHFRPTTDLTDQELDEDRVQPTLNFDACNLNKPPKTLDDDDDDDEGRFVNESRPTGVARGIAGREHRRNLTTRKKGRRVRQSTAATDAMGPDDDVEAFFGGAASAVEEGDIETISSARTKDPPPSVEMRSMSTMSLSRRLRSFGHGDEEKCEDDSASLTALKTGY